MIHLPDLRGFKMKQNSTGVIKIHDISIYSRRIYARVRTGGASASSRTRICFCTCFINCGIWKVSATSNIHARSKVFLRMGDSTSILVVGVWLTERGEAWSIIYTCMYMYYDPHPTPFFSNHLSTYHLNLEF